MFFVFILVFRRRTRTRREPCIKFIVMMKARYKPKTDSNGVTLRGSIIIYNKIPITFLCYIFYKSDSCVLIIKALNTFKIIIVFLISRKIM